MGFVKNIRVSKERAQAGFGTEQDRPPAVLGARKVGRVGVAEDASAQGDELTRVGLLLTKHRIGNFSHQFNFEIASLAMTEVI